MSHKRNPSKASEQDIERFRKKAQDEIISKLMDELDEDPLSLGIQHDLTACGESTVDVYGPATVPLEKVMDEDRIRKETRRKFLNAIADINVRLRTTRNPILKRLLKSHKKKLIEQAQRFESTPQITILEDELPVTTPWGKTTAARRLFLTADEEAEEAGVKSGAKILDTEMGKLSRSNKRVTPIYYETERGEREKQRAQERAAQERAKQQREEEQRKQEEAEKEHQFRRRQIDRYLGDLKAIDMGDSTVEEIEQFLEDLGPRDEEEEILASNLRKLLEKVKDERGR